MSQAEWHLEGKTAVVTGATSGLGKLAALALADRDAQLFLVCRNPDRARRTAAEITTRTGNPNIHTVIADLSAQAQVRRAAGEILAAADAVHLLLNNAGAIFPGLQVPSTFPVLRPGATTARSRRRCRWRRLCRRG